MSWPNPLQAPDRASRPGFWHGHSLANARARGHVPERRRALLRPPVRSFDTLAPHYHWMERLLAGEKLQRCRTAFLDRVPASANVLSVGEGHGRFLTACHRARPAAHITCADSSARMIGTARRRLAGLALQPDRVEFIQADILDWTPPARAFEVIATHFFLDCFTADQLAQVVPKLAQTAKPEAIWLLSDFQAPAGGAGRPRAQLILAMMYAFFRLATRLPARGLTPPDFFLRDAGFVLRERRVSEWGLLHTDWWQREPLRRAVSDGASAEVAPPFQERGKILMGQAS